MQAPRFYQKQLEPGSQNNFLLVRNASSAFVGLSISVQSYSVNVCFHCYP